MITNKKPNTSAKKVMKYDKKKKKKYDSITTRKNTMTKNAFFHSLQLSLENYRFLPRHRTIFTIIHGGHLGNFCSPLYTPLPYLIN